MCIVLVLYMSVHKFFSGPLPDAMPVSPSPGTLAPMPGKPLLVQRIPDLHAVLGADGKDLELSMRRIHEKGGFFLLKTSKIC